MKNHREKTERGLDSPPLQPSEETNPAKNTIFGLQATRQEIPVASAAHSVTLFQQPYHEYNMQQEIILKVSVR